MFSNVALDIFVGLIFIFLLYSLLATILMELISHFMSMRARMLVKTLRRMLEDNPPEIFGRKRGWTLLDLWTDTKQSVYRFFYPLKDLSLLRRFYAHPSVKYLGESKSSSKPSYITAVNFSQTMLHILRGDNYTGEISQIEAIRKFLFEEAEGYLRQSKNMLAQSAIIPHLQEVQKLLADPGISTEDISATIALLPTIPVKNENKDIRDALTEKLKTMLTASADPDAFRTSFKAEYSRILDIFHNRIAKDTLKHLQRLFIEAHMDIDRFRQRLEMWFDETMNRASGWYKRQTQWVLLIMGFTMAVWGNIDTIAIYKTLAKDKAAREQLVNLSMQANEKYTPVMQQIAQRQSTDSIATDSAGNKVIYKTQVITTVDTSLSEAKKTLTDDMDAVKNVLGLGWEKSNKWNGWSLLGWIITALAISLGAPFWFDLLNKIMHLRLTGNKPATPPNVTSAATPAAGSSTVARTPIERKG